MQTGRQAVRQAVRQAGRQEGRQAGRQEGRQEGRKEGRKENILGSKTKIKSIGEAYRMDDLMNFIVKHKQTKPSIAAMSSSHNNMMRHKLLKLQVALQST